MSSSSSDTAPPSSDKKQNNGKEEEEDGLYVLEWNAHTKAILALCLCIASMSFQIMNVFPYSGFMAMFLVKGVTEETAGPYVGFLASSFEIGSSCMSYPWGKLADIYGRKFVLTVSLCLGGIFTLLFGTAQSYVAALIFRFLSGLCNSIMSTTKTSTSELAKGNHLVEKRGMGLVVGMWGWGFLWGPALGGLLAEPVQQYPNSTFVQGHRRFLDRFPFLLPNLVGFLLCLAATVVVQLWLPETLPSERRRSPRKIPNDIFKLMRKLKRLACGWWHGNNDDQRDGTLEEKTRLVNGTPTDTKIDDDKDKDKDKVTKGEEKQIRWAATHMTTAHIDDGALEEKSQLVNGTPTAAKIDKDEDEVTNSEEKQIRWAATHMTTAHNMMRDIDEEDELEQSIRRLSSLDDMQEMRRMHDRSGTLLCTQLYRPIAPRASSIRVRPSVARRMSRYSFLSSSPPRKRKSSIFPTVPTMGSILSRIDTRMQLFLYWIFCFLQTSADEAFPLYCISKAGGLGLSAYSIGNILSMSGLVFGICQYFVYASIVNRRGLYRSLKISSVCLPLLLLIPFSIFFPQYQEEEGWAGTVYLVIILAASRILASVFYASVFIALNRTVPDSDRATMNGLQMLGGSKCKALGPLFAGFLVAFFSTSTKNPRLGGFLVWFIIGGMGALYSLAITFLIEDDDDDDEQPVEQGFNDAYESKEQP